MVSLKQIRYLILACLVVSLPTQPMGWFDSTWKKLGFGVAAAVLVGIGYGIKRYKKYSEQKDFLRKNGIDHRLFNEDLRTIPIKLLIKELINDQYCAALYVNPYFVGLLKKEAEGMNRNDRFAWEMNYALKKCDFIPRREDNVERSASSITEHLKRARQNIIKANLDDAITNNNRELILFILKWNNRNKCIHEQDLIAFAIKKHVGVDLFEFILNNGIEARDRSAHLNCVLVTWVRDELDDQESCNVIKLLLEHGANNINNDYGYSPALQDAIRLKKTNQARLLFERGANIHPDKQIGDKICSYAYKKHSGDQEFIELLDAVRRRRYELNKNKIAQEIFDHPQEIEHFNKPITDIMGAYAGEYPLIETHLLEFEQAQERPSQMQEDQGSSVPALLHRQDPLSLDAGAV